MADVWEILRARLDYASFVTRPVADFERADLTWRDGGRYKLIKNPHGDSGAGPLPAPRSSRRRAVRAHGEASLGSGDNLVTHLESAGVFAVERLGRLTAAMWTNGSFGEEPPPLYEKGRKFSTS